MSNWEKLCEKVNELVEYRIDKEDSFHLAVEKQLKTTFQWPSEYIKHERHVKIGSKSTRMDTVLEGDGFGIIIEMKTLDNPLEGDEDEQLIAYMSTYYTTRNKIRCKYGLLIGKKIKVYFQSEPEKKPELVAAFGFDKDSKDGNSLFEILSYENCSDGKLSGYMKELHEIKEPLPPPTKGNGGGGGKGNQGGKSNCDSEFSRVKQAFEKTGFEMLKVLPGEDFIISKGKNHVQFVPHFREHQILRNGIPIWQIVWANLGSQPVRDIAWFKEQMLVIQRTYPKCYYYVDPKATVRAKLWIPTARQHPFEAVIEDLIKIVSDTKGIMGYDN